MLDLAEKALKVAEKASNYAEVRFERSTINKVTCNNMSFDVVDRTETYGLCIRLLKDNILAVAFTNNLDLQSIKKAVDRALKSSMAAKKIAGSEVIFSEEKSNKKNYEVKQKIKIQDIGIDERIKELEAIDKSILQTKIKSPTRSYDLTDEIREKYFINSEGSRIHSIIPRINFEYLISIQANGNIIQRIHQIAGTGGWEQLKKWQLSKRLTDETKLLQKISKAKKSPIGKLDLILSPSLVGIASHESTGHPYEADRILGREGAQAGETFVTKDHLGKRIGSEVVNVVDDPTVPNSNGFYLYDDEGIKARRRFLIKNGIINELLHNRWSASVFGVKSNGAARACSWDAEPIVRMANTFVLPGERKLDDMVEEVKKGIFIKSYMEWNIDDKRFNQRYIGLEAYEISNGRIGGLVQKPKIEITTPAFWSSIDAVSKDLKFDAGTCGKSDPIQGVPVWFGGPYIRLKDIVIA